jgi:hypothetical protein
MVRSENAASHWAGLHAAVATLWANGEGIRERIPAMPGRLAYRDPSDRIGRGVTSRCAPVLLLPLAVVFCGAVFALQLP